ncbi:RNA cap guanine-N2 methyltransferase,S-adenosyl-L-methionine-dependent methyltransferase [Cinara cedri]|uniref:Trimethylguanosine synthase n=1 Tax=Cinara cedri TaxID=506608 RepID=A0A5E4MYK0_9HEMI|nr:RNA cap guanine-N2 methyltransferase,S-adenosyl-L-methionine-dependent methyltransferase [Cinara cedri]
MRFDAGTLLDHESFYSVCPEVLEKHIADRCRFPNGVTVDPFCGTGGNINQLAKTCRKVLAMDIDGTKLELARHIVGVYGCAKNIEFRKNDFFGGPSGQRANIVVTSPPWGGLEYLRQDSYSPLVLGEAYGGGEAIARIARSMAPKLTLHLPRTVDKSEYDDLCTYLYSVRSDRQEAMFYSVEI